ncbi:MAG TPA: hypothetical protein VII35_04645 [Steroidobacteraceae bacterium]
MPTPAPYLHPSGTAGASTSCARTPRWWPGQRAWVSAARRLGWNSTAGWRPFLGTDLRIIGDDDLDVAAGETGEIVGLSPLLMSGYHGNDAASGEATWTDRRGRRWLRTGDLGRLDADGFLYIVDRKKDMILSGAQNIYPADIEAVMRTHPEVADVAVVGVRSVQWGETPVAVVVPAGGAPPAAQSLVEWTNARVGKQQRIRGARSDILSAAVFARMKRENPGLAQLEVANRGHVPLLDEPECIAALDGFLSRILPAPLA